MAAFTCTSPPPPPIHLRSPSVSLSTRLTFSVSPESIGLRTRVSLSSSVSKKISRVSRFQRRGVFSEAQETATGIPIVNDTTWDSLVLKAEEPVLVDFWAPWCGPCKMIDPIVNELAQQYTGKIKFYKLNTDESPATPGTYGVRSIPTIMIFVKGEKKDTIIGAVPKTTLAKSIDKFL